VVPAVVVGSKAPTEADALAAEQLGQLGDVTCYATRFFLGQHLRHMRVVGILATIDIRERFAVGVADFKATGNLLDTPGWGKLRTDITTTAASHWHGEASYFPPDASPQRRATRLPGTPDQIAS
jgi:hypothetical protein